MPKRTCDVRFTPESGYACSKAWKARTRELAKSLEDLRTAQDRLVQTEKLASLGQLTAGIAHEIKNPLNFVNNFSGVYTELSDELQDVLNRISIDHTARSPPMPVGSAFGRRAPARRVN